MCGVALGRQVLLRHLWLDLLASLRDHAADFLANRVGLDDVVAAVDLCEVLAFDAGFGCLCGVLVGGDRGARWHEERQGRTYRVTSAEFLLSSNNGSASLSSVQSRFAAHDGLLGGSAAAGLASNLRDGVPVIHLAGFYLEMC